MSHTKGPWEWVGTSIESKSKEACRTAPNYGSVMGLYVDCGMWCQGGTARIETLSEADARLIAAAPDLLEALEELVPYAGQSAIDAYPEKDIDKYGKIAKARAAIAKAKGDQP